MKPILDFVLAAILLVPLALVMLVEAVAIALDSRGPILFVQERVGRGGRPFRMYKFRTMIPAEHSLDDQGKLKPDAERITSLGHFLRRTSLDELPQLWNVLRGELSLVGPRPLLMRYMPRYTPEQVRRHEVRPGITGWAQVNGRNALSWEEKFALDVWYVDHRTLFLDLKILAMTLARVLGREGVSRQGHATMPEFMGSDGGKKES